MTPTKVAAPVVDESTKENNDAPPKVDDTNNTNTNNNAKGPASAVEFEPPLACVRRILKNSLPSSTNVGKDASAAFARASGIFIIYLTACANDFARENRRQTITANDVLAAIKVGFKILWSVSSWFNLYFTTYPIL
jgi:histone H3/H4